MASTALMLTKELIEIGPQRDHLPFNGVVWVSSPLRNAGLESKPAMKWMWRVDLHHHRQVYETCAPLFVLRHRNGASRSARTFVSSSSGKRLCYLSYRGEIGTPGQS